MAVKRRAWTEQDLETLIRMYPTTDNSTIGNALGRTRNQIRNKAAKLRLKKPQEVREAIKQWSCFKPGQRPWNHGKKGLQIGGKDHQFKPWHKPVGTMAVGSERQTKDGLIERKISDTGIRRKDWRPVHVLVWEEQNGPVPAGHVVIFADGNHRNFDIENLLMLSRADLMRRNSYLRYPEPLRELIRLRARLNRQINKRGKHEKQDRRSKKPPICHAGGPAGRGQPDGDRASQSDQ